MRLILDTHVWLWTLLEPDRVVPAVKEEIRRESNERWLSPISVWELSILAEKGRVKLKTTAKEWVEQAFEKMPLREAPLTFEIARVSRDIRLPHQDPADRFIAATARVLGLTLVTGDGKLLDCPDLDVLPNG